MKIFLNLIYFIKSYNDDDDDDDDDDGDDDDEGYFFGVSVQYSENLHNLHNELPFLPILSIQNINNWKLKIWKDFFNVFKIIV